MPNNNEWIEITVVTSHEAVEAVSAILYDAGVSGVAIEDPADIISSKNSPKDWDYIEERLLPKDGNEVKVKGYLLFKGSTDRALEFIKSSVGKLDEYGLDRGPGQVYTKEVKEEDWANAWKEYYKPFRIGKNLVVKPSWEEYCESPGDIVLELDPGMAFGTGTHETTRMCLELLEKYVKKDSSVLDIGCGSGILSIAASKLGAGKVTGVDTDEVAVKASMENIRISGVKNVVIKQGNLFDEIEDKADIIVANIIADVIIHMCGSVRKFIKKDGCFISSGIIKDRSEDVKKALQENGFNIIDAMEMGEWVAFAASMEG